MTFEEANKINIKQERDKLFGCNLVSSICLTCEHFGWCNQNLSLMVCKRDLAIGACNFYSKKAENNDI